MDEEDYQREKMLNEYNSLRDEILQIYSQQMNLIYCATVTGAAAIIATLIKPEAILVGLPILLAVLIGICVKSIANYNRIFRTGAYLCVVHEQQGKSAADFNPSPKIAAWHTRWRKLSRSERGKKYGWIGSEGPRAEALFLFCFGLVGWILTIGILKENLFTGQINLAIFFISVLLSLVLYYFVYQLKKVLSASENYEEDFREILRDEYEKIQNYK